MAILMSSTMESTLLGHIIKQNQVLGSTKSWLYGSYSGLNAIAGVGTEHHSVRSDEQGRNYLASQREYMVFILLLLAEAEMVHYGCSIAATLQLKQ